MGPRGNTFNTNVVMGSARMLWSLFAILPTWLWFGHGSSGRSMLLEHERHHDLGMDALVTVCSWKLCFAHTLE